MVRKLSGVLILTAIIGGLVGLTCWAFHADYGRWWLGLLLWLGCSIVAGLLALAIDLLKSE